MQVRTRAYCQSDRAEQLLTGKALCLETLNPSFGAVTSTPLVSLRPRQYPPRSSLPAAGVHDTPAHIFRGAKRNLLVRRGQRIELRKSDVAQSSSKPTGTMHRYRRVIPHWPSVGYSLLATEFTNSPYTHAIILQYTNNSPGRAQQHAKLRDRKSNYARRNQFNSPNATMVNTAMPPHTRMTTTLNHPGSSWT